MRVAVGGALALLALDAGWAAWSAFSGLRSARASIEAGAEALQRGELGLAASTLADAQAAAGGVAAFGAHPSMMLAGALPLIGDDVHAVETMAHAAEQAAAGGEALAAGLAVTGWTGEGLPGVVAGGRIDPEVIRTASPGLHAAAAGLGEAVATVLTIDTDELVGPLATVVTDARERLTEQASLVSTASDLSDLLPSMLGERTPRDYLLAFQNLSAPRGTGGFLGFYGTLHASDGEITLDALRPASDVPAVAPVPVPPDVARRYGPFGVRTTMYASNYSPDVPTSSRVTLAIAESAGLGAFDGVVWTDTVFLAELLRAVGPVDSAGWPEPLTTDNLVDVLNRQSFLLDDPIESNAAQAQIGLDVWAALLTRPAQPTAFATAMSNATRSGHFSVYSVAPDERVTLGDLGADGAFEPGANPLAVIWQDAAASRAGYFATKVVTSTLAIDSDATASVSTTVTLRNEAPSEPPSILLGDGLGGVPVGHWGADVEVYLPEEAERVRVRTSEPSINGVDTAFDHPVADCWLFADAGGEMTCTVSYEAPGAATASGGSWEYRMQVLPQPSLHPSPTSIEITLPAGARVVASSPGVTFEGVVARWQGEPVTPVDVWVRYELAA